MKKENLTKRIIELVVGVFLVAAGVAVSIHANLGTSPVTSFPYTLSCVFGMTSGRWTIVVHALFITLQFLVLRKNFKIYNLLQLPLAILFGSFIDLMNSFLGFLHYENYFQQWVLCIIGIILVGIGVAFEVEADIIVLAIEGFAGAVTEVTGKKFGDIKMLTDCGIVATAVVIGLVFNGEVYGVREGTVAAAVFVGQIAKLFKRFVFDKIKK